MDQLSVTFAALCDPTRRKIISRLARGPANVRELAEPFSISQQAISKHLAYLERAKLVTKHREGREHICTLKPRTLRLVADWAEPFRKYWEDTYETLDSVLEEMKSDERSTKD